MLAGSTTASLTKKDVPAVVKTVKAHLKNSGLCREGILALQTKLFDSEGSRAAQKTFTLNKTGGISVVLHSIEHHLSDASYVELAVGFLCSLMNATSRSRGRICTKIAKRGGSKIMMNVITTHQKQPKILVAALSILVPLAACDRKINSLCRSTGALNSLISIIKMPNIPKDLLVTALSAMNALSKNDHNIGQLGKKGAVPLLVEICQRFIIKPAPVGLKYALRSIINLCKLEKNVSEFVKEGGVVTMLGLLKGQKDSIDVQKLAVDVLKCLVMDDDGRMQFSALGGSPSMVAILEENNIDKNDEQLLDIVLHLLKFHDMTELPITHEEEVRWSIAEALERRTTTDLDTSVSSRFCLSMEGTEKEFFDDAAPPPDSEEEQVRAADFPQYSPELDPAFLAALQQRVLSRTMEPPDRLRTSSVNLSTAQQTQHVRPFTAPRPSPSCGSSIEFVPDFTEELYQPHPTLRLEIIRHWLQRLTHPEQLLNEVVYDDIPRSRGPLGPSTFLYKSKACTAPSLRFSSHFESGNLKRAIRVYDTEYDLILNTDVNSEVHAQWFYFSVENAIPGVVYRFNIINMEKSQSQFNDGQRPLMFSEKDFMTRGAGWLRSGHDVTYLRNAYVRRLRRFSTGDCPNYFTLHFAVQFPHPDDRAYLAYCYPYTYTDLQNYLRTLPEIHPHATQFFVKQEFCRTLGNNVCNLLTITTFLEDGPVPMADRKVLVCSGRVHPGESAASWMVKGMIDFLIDNTNPTSKYLRDNFVWKIVPMLNPDGVVNGNHRCSLSGHDLNREWLSPDRQLYPEIWYLKNYLKHLKQKEARSVFMYIDFHGHSKRRNVFMYGCSAKPKKTEPIGTVANILERLFPRLLSEIAPFFAFDHCCFKVQKGHNSTGRVVAWRQIGIRLSYTLEASLCGGDRVGYRSSPAADGISEFNRDADPTLQQVGHFNTGHYMAMGMFFCKAVQIFCNMELDEGRKVIDAIKFWCNTNVTDFTELRESSDGNGEGDDTGDISDTPLQSSEENGPPRRSKVRSGRSHPRAPSSGPSKVASDGGPNPGPSQKNAIPSKAQRTAAPIVVTSGPASGAMSQPPRNTSFCGAGRFAVPPPPVLVAPVTGTRITAVARSSHRQLASALGDAHLYEEDDGKTDEEEDEDSDDEAEEDDEALDNSGDDAVD